jgi:hypothetical protein
MKNIFKAFITIAIMGASFSVAKSQNNKKVEENTIKKTTPDTTKLRIGVLKINIVKDNKNDTTYKNMFEKKGRKKKKSDGVSGYWTGFGLGFNNYVNASGNMNFPVGYGFLELNSGKSINVTLNFYEQNINLYRNKLLLVTGLGVEWDNYRFSNKNTVLIANQPSISAYTDTLNHNSKSKLVTDYINVPLIISFSTRNDKHGNNFHIGAGVIAGYMWNSHTKRKYETDGSKHKDFDSFNVNPFKVNSTVRIGHGGITFYGTYALTTMFKNKQSPVLYPFSMGISLDF